MMLRIDDAKALKVGDKVGRQVATERSATSNKDDVQIGRVVRRWPRLQVKFDGVSNPVSIGKARLQRLFRLNR
jgi:hypothetical protein